MRLLFLTHAFNSLTQRLYVECERWGHEVSIEFDIHDSVTEEAVELWRPELVVAPYLRRPIPERIWRRIPCLVVHPGPVGDRGPSALDWAILRGETEWGVTLLQAEAEMDAGPIWASRRFPLRLARKSSLYRHEVTEAAVACLREARGPRGRRLHPGPAGGAPRARRKRLATAADPARTRDRLATRPDSRGTA